MPQLLRRLPDVGPLGVRQRNREVLDPGRDRGAGASDQVVGHCAHDGDEPVADDFQGARIDPRSAGMPTRSLHDAGDRRLRWCPPGQGNHAAERACLPKVSPLCSHMWPGKRADVTSLLAVLERLRTQFKVGEVCIVADRCMIGAAAIEPIKARGWRSIPGVRMRRTRAANEQLLARAGRFEQVYANNDDLKAPSPLKVKEVWVEDRRYVVCVNEGVCSRST
ncbi:MAG: hypothetical protein IT514_12510 [Burkholderiales bacterium]|nr:hypothetical protein [Burkholderiales bacterium]